MPFSTAPRPAPAAGPLAQLIEGFDWGATPLGPRADWPQSLCTVVDILLSSRFAMWMSWGPELTCLYNDAYATILAGKHPQALGRPAREVWAEIWPDIGPRIERVLATGEATWDEALPLFIERRGYLEETFHTFSYSPLRDEAGRVAGHFCVVSEETERVIGARRFETQRWLAASLAGATDEAAVLDTVRREFGRNRRDLPFALLYRLDDEEARTRHLAAAIGFEAGEAAAAAAASVPTDILREAEAGPRVLSLRGLAPFPSGDWSEPPTEALVLPIARRRRDRPAGILVAGCNPHRRLDGSFRDVLVLLAGQIGSALATARARDAERRRAEALAELDRAKTAFFSNVSHEFRTPLTLMLGPLEEAAARAPAELGEILAVAHRNARRLRHLVNALLDVSRIEAGQTEPRFVAVDLAALTTELAANFRPAMAEAGLDFTVDAAPLRAPVTVDAEMWERIVLNLLSNAFKFTLAGEVRVGLRAVAADRVELTVRDTGAGIPPDHLGRVFDRFHRVEGGGGRSLEGSGIGLALVRDLVGLHGGTIGVESTPGEGSLFRVVIPSRQAGNTVAYLPAPGRRPGAGFVEEALTWIGRQDAPAAAAAEEEDEPGRILLADDNADMRAYLRRLLVEAGHAVAAVADGAAALDLLRGGAGFDLVVTDVMMPRLDGIGLLRAIRADPVLRGLAVILVSARAGEEVLLEGIEAQADAYLVKPFSPRELVARVGATLAGARTRGAVLASLSADIADRTAERDRLWELSEDLLVRTDHDGQLLQVSPSWARMLGLAAAEAPAIDYWSLIHPDDRAPTRAALATMRRTGEPVRFENRLLPHGGGAPVCVAWALSPDRDAADSVFGVGRDVTAERDAREALLREIAERERVEAQLRQMQRLEAIGQLTSGVAHDFNNLLTVIVSSLEVLETYPGVERGERQIAMIRTAARRGADLTGQLLAFSRKQHLQPVELDLNAVVGAMGELLRTTLGGTIAVRIELADGLWTALADQTQVELAVLNLAINARDAMPGGGTLTVETANVELGPPGGPEEPPMGFYVTVGVTDTGSGIPPDVFERVFEPFFTTKPPGKGSGLGLPQVYGFAKQSGGGVRIRTEQGAGTTVCIFLPRVPE